MKPVKFYWNQRFQHELMETHRQIQKYTSLCVHGENWQKVPYPIVQNEHNLTV
jgi:hypothetical protein